MSVNSQEFTARVEALGLRPQWIAEHLGIDPRTPERWATKNLHVKAFAWEALERLELEADEQVRELTEDLRNHPLPPRILIDDTGPDSLPRAWQRAVALRVKKEIPDLLIFVAPAPES